MTPVIITDCRFDEIIKNIPYRIGAEIGTDHSFYLVILDSSYLAPYRKSSVISMR
jgi:hypothetical protein